MCFEDVKMGRRRWVRFSNVSGGPGITIPGDGQRVGIRFVGTGAGNLVVTAASSNAAQVNAAPDAVAVVARLVSTFPIVDMTLEQHGTVVQGSFGFPSVAVYSVMEIMDTNLDNPPK